jgi:acyl-coenzyme A thioesterase PaaI-like protein
VTADADRRARVALADAVRRLTQTVVAAAAPAEVLAEVAARVAAAEQLLAAGSTGVHLWPEPDPARGVAEWFPASPAVGWANPVAPPVVVAADGDAVVGTGILGPAYGGPPGCVHGGVVAMIMDDLLGAATVMGGTPGMTGTLTVRYHAPTPLGQPLAWVARTEAVDGRKVHARAELHAGGRRTASAEGIFVAVDADRFDRLRAPGSAPDPAGADGVDRGTRR